MLYPLGFFLDLEHVLIQKISSVPKTKCERVPGFICSLRVVDLQCHRVTQ